MIYPGIRSEIGSALRTPQDRVLNALDPDAAVTAFFAKLGASPKLWLDPSQRWMVSADLSGATPISTGVGVGRVLDRSGAGNHVGKAAPSSLLTWQTDGTLSWLQANGGSDYLLNTLANFVLSGTDKLTLIAGLRKASDAAVGVLAETSANWTANAGTFTVRAPHVAGQPTFYFGLNSSALDIVVGTGYAAPISTVVECAFDIAGAGILDEIKPVINGTLITTGAAGSPGTGNFGNYVLNLLKGLTGNVYGLMLIGGAVSAADRLMLRACMAGKSGVAL